MSTILWKPTHPEQTNLWRFMKTLEKQQHQVFEDYHSLYAFSIKEPAIFWSSVCSFFKIDFDTPAKHILNDYEDMLEARWFEGAHFNFAERLLSRKDDHPALVSIDEFGKRDVITYKELHLRVAACAAGLKKEGVQAHDRVAGIMPNVAFTVIAMLATTSIGAIWSSCSPDFGSAAIVDRIGQIEPKVVFICDGHTYQGKAHSASEKIQDLLDRVPNVIKIVIYPNLSSSQALIDSPKIQALADFLVPTEALTFTSMPFAHPIYILFSSGTTGQPKCIIHGAGGTLLQHVKELGLHSDITSKDNLLFYTTCGWMMWNWMVSILALGATLTLYEGSPTYPSSMHLFDILDQENITVFGTSAKFISSIEKEGASPKQDHALKALRLILSTGSPLMPHNFEYVYQHIKSNIPLSSMSGGTDIISCFALANPLVPVYSGELQCIGLGMDVKVFDDDGHSVQGQQGELVCTQAFPSMPVGFWHDDNKTRYRSTYFEQIPGVWVHGDFAEITEHHGVIIYGRSDATLKPGGVRIGTAEIYRQIETMPEILDSVVIGQHFNDDVRVVLFVKLAEHTELTDTLQSTIRKKIHDGASPRHVPSIILQVKDIPHTINGKLVEMAVSQMVHGLPIKNKDSIANPESLTYFKDRPELSK